MITQDVNLCILERWLVILGYQCMVHKYGLKKLKAVGLIALMLKTLIES